MSLLESWKTSWDYDFSFWYIAELNYIWRIRAVHWYIPWLAGTFTNQNYILFVYILQEWQNTRSFTFVLIIFSVGSFYKNTYAISIFINNASIKYPTIRTRCQVKYNQNILTYVSTFLKISNNSAPKYNYLGKLSGKIW